MNNVNNSTKEMLLKMCNDKGNCNLDEKTYLECANFLFLTSWFEELLFNDDKQQNPINTKDLSARLVEKINLTIFDFYGDHFASRYLQKDLKNIDYTHCFNSLRINRQDHKELVYDSLRKYQEKKLRDNNLLFSYILIAYRFRNNMFHGNKGLINISQYVKEFEVINRFLLLLLESILDKGFKGYNEQKEG